MDFLALQHFRKKASFFSRCCFQPRVQDVFPFTLEAPPPGFGYPLGVFCLISLGHSFRPNTLGLFPSELSSFLLIELALSSQPFRSCAYLKNLSTFQARFSGFLPRGKLLPPLCVPHGLDEGRVLCSPGSLSLSGSFSFGRG